MFHNKISLPDLDALHAHRNHGRTIIFETVYGSKLYGCDIEGSDHDIRGVYLPGLYDFLREVKEEPAALDPDQNLGESDDIVYFPVGMFVDQVIRMKSNATEIFFAAMQAREDGHATHPVMNLILDRAADLISADYAGFVGHARQRAAKYIEGDDENDMTLQGNKHVLACLKEAAAASLEAPALRIMDVDGLADKIAEHASISRGENKGGDPVLRVNTRQLPENTRIAEALRMTDARLERFRVKHLDADPDQMFKDLCTSLRMMETSAEIMETGRVRFPHTRGDYYRAIRHGRVDRKDILPQIDAAQEHAIAAVENGTTPLRPAYPEGEHVSVRNEIVAQVRYLALKGLTL
jgi:predicted nucleotidyltransferase